MKYWPNIALLLLALFLCVYAWSDHRYRDPGSGGLFALALVIVSKALGIWPQSRAALLLGSVTSLLAVMMTRGIPDKGLPRAATAFCAVALLFCYLFWEKVHKRPSTLAEDRRHD